jgi:acetyltransferase
VKECAEKGIKSITIVTAGFAENGRVEGGKIQKEISEIAARHGIVLCGPNCFGTISSRTHAANFCEAIPSKLAEGNVGIVMQTGGLLASIVHLALSRGVNFSYFVSSGNEAGAQSADYLRYMVDDPQTEVLCAFIEGIQDKAKFVEVADLALRKRKPMIVIKIGSSARGTEAAFRHTGSTTGSDAEFEDLCKQKGIIRVSDLDELIEMASFFSTVCGKKWPTFGRRVGVMTLSGGGAGLIADTGCSEGLDFPPLSDATYQNLLPIVPEFGFVANPLDVTTQVFADPAIYLRCVEHMINEPAFDILAFAWSIGMPREPGPPVKIIEGTSEITKRTNKLSMMFTIPHAGLNDYGRELLKKSQMPLVQGVRKAFKAINALIEYDKAFSAQKG